MIRVVIVHHKQGSVAGGRRVPDLGANELPDPLQRRRSSPAQSPDSSAAGPDAKDTSDRDGETPAAPAEERPRSDNSVGFPERGGRRGQGDPGWRWKDLLSNMPQDEDGAPSPSDRKKRSDDQT